MRLQNYTYYNNYRAYQDIWFYEFSFTVVFTVGLIIIVV